MGLESVTYLNDLVAANPVSGDPRSEGDDHLRNIKAALLATFPGLAGRALRRQTKTVSYTVLTTDNCSLIYIATTTITLSLTAAATLGNGHFFMVHADGYDVTIDPNGAETINGAATATIPSGTVGLVFCNGTSFNVAVVPMSTSSAPLGPYVDSSPVVVGSGDPTKKMRFEVDGLTTATTRVIIVQDSDIDLTNIGLAQDFRLTLVSGTPVSMADISGSTLYASPRTGNRIALYNGSRWFNYTSAEFSLALSSLTSGKPYDAFCYQNAGVPTLEFLVWTDDTTRGTSLARQNGILVKSGDSTRRYLGTFYTTSTTTTEDTVAKRYLWNYYHRSRRLMQALETTNTWNYTTATWRQANAAAANQLNYVVGVPEDSIDVEVVASFSNTNAGVFPIAVGIGYDSTSTPASLRYGAETALTVNGRAKARETYEFVPQVGQYGRHYMAWLEYSAAAGTTTWYGDDTGGAGDGFVKSGITGHIWA